MQLELSNRSRIEKEIVGALKNAIDSHGPITLSNRHSAAKRVYCALKNLPRDEKRKIETFFQTVMDDLGYEGWTLRWMPSDAMVWRWNKTIDICPMDSLGECKQLLLHEIAHIDTGVSHGHQHHLRFWRRLEGLIQKYLCMGLSQYQIDFAKFYCPEFVQEYLIRMPRPDRTHVCEGGVGPW